MADLREGLGLDSAKAEKTIGAFIRQQVEQAGARGVVVGISGGLDSAVVAFLCSRALGPDRVQGLFLPERDTAPETPGHARAVAQAAGIRLDTVDLTPALTALGCYQGAVAKALKSPVVGRVASTVIRGTGKNPFELTVKSAGSTVVREAVAFLRLKHRLRMCALYHRAERDGFLVAGCLNRTERLTGFFVRYGDTAADFAPILPLFKTQVRALAAYLGVPQAVIERPPTPDLIPGITDEGALGISYEALDLVLVGLERGLDPESLAAETGVAATTIARIRALVAAARSVSHDPPFPEMGLEE
ncbi:MAG: NAD(+) synthase [Moorellales bacterium]